MSGPSQFQNAVEPQPPHQPSGSGTRSRRYVTRACLRCRISKQKCDGQTPCQTCQSKSLACEYDNASDPGDRRKFRASAREYDVLLQQQAILDDLFSAIRLDTADEALQRIREGASPFDVAGLLNSAAQHPNASTAEFFATSSTDDLNPSIEQLPPQAHISSLADGWYPSAWYNEVGQMNSHGPQAVSQNVPQFFRYATPDGNLVNRQQQAAQEQTHNSWHPSPQGHEEVNESSFIGQYGGPDVTTDYFRQELGFEPDPPEEPRKDVDREPQRRR